MPPSEDSGPSGTNVDLPSGAAKAVAVRRMFDSIAPRYDLVNRIMTFRMDVAWRRRTVSMLELPAGSIVMDVACGTGDLCRDLSGAGHSVVGLDMSWGMLAAARTDAPLLHADALKQPVGEGSLDGLTCGFALRNFTSLEPFFFEAARLVRSGGRIALLEVDSPVNPLLRFGHAFYFGRVVPLVGGLFSDRDAYRYLPRSVAYLPPEEDLLSMVAAAGFGEVQKTRLSGGIAQLITATRS
ncbi:MAG: ubiquinone/menaquinone biosynthesis methyltransferase [Acidimicrobiia bacterium]|nr:ubiquinone/menaquinone biosynthesis methyltransferase [Actinomycetota bacterium]MBL6924078.1 ubiquinone/menaquinone biosynthesis methyltransferase [Acidimicrobiia bacterium]MBL6926580.1 ubiquinone/menaquinone biosynthesis methyltransferase [Acidimicrobiia bacterium]